MQKVPEQNNSQKKANKWAEGTGEELEVAQWK